MPDLVLISNPRSRGTIAHWMLEEVGAPYAMKHVEYGPAMKGPELRALNPMGKVPILRHGDQVVTETAAILAYLADTFPDAGLAPPPGRRGAYYRWLFFAAGPIDQATTNLVLDVTVPEDRRGMVGYGSMPEVLDTIEQAISSGPYVAASHFTAADVMLGASLTWGMMFGTLEKRPAFQAYVAGLRERPAFLRTIGAFA